MLHFSYKDCPPFDLDKLLEDVQNGLYPITAYHLLFPTQSSMNFPTKSSISDKVLTSSSSSLSSLVSATTENDLTTPIQSIADPSIFHSHTTTESTLFNNTTKSRTATISSTNPQHERTASILADLDSYRRDSQSSNATNHLLISTVTLTDEKENRRITDIQCKVKNKESGLLMVNQWEFLSKSKLTLSFFIYL